jgi:hypothetical protein
MCGGEFAIMSNYMVIRQDDNGVCTILADRLAEHESQVLVQMMTQRGHKATYLAKLYLNPHQREQILITHRVHL